MSYNYTNGDGVAVLLPAEPNGATEPVSILDNAVRQIKAYLNDPIAGPAALLSSLIPIGLVFPGWVTVTPPPGFLLADGTAVSRTTYAALFAVIGTTFGPGNGTTTFNLPEVRDKFIKGKASDAIGAIGGAATVTLLDTQNAKHRHGMTAANTPAGDAVSVGFNTATAGRAMGWDSSDGPGNQADQGDVIAMNTGYDKAADALPHENLPPYITLVGIIKY